MLVSNVVAQACGVILLLGSISTLHDASIRGVVRSEDGAPVAQATVRIKGTLTSTLTADDGSFALPVDAHPDRRVRLTASAVGFFIAGEDASIGSDVEFRLRRWSSGDSPDYRWLPTHVPRGAVRELATDTLLRIAERLPPRPAKTLRSRLALGCRDCHLACYEEWAASGHARGTRNVRFVTMYAGSDAAGHQGQPTRRFFNRDYGGWRPLLPDPTRPHYGPGYKLDFPRTAGNCAACHLPGAAVDDALDVDIENLADIDREGVHCDFCHKVADVALDERTGLPPLGQPGVLSMTFKRPRSGSQIFFGPLDDVDAGVDAHLPLMKRSEICAPCHQASFWGTPVYESFAEWKASTYAAKGISCQSCHMKPTGSMRNVAPGRGGVDRDPQSLASHNFAGTEDLELMRGAARLEVAASIDQAESLCVRVTVVNAAAGHHIPTDSPLRQLILVVRASSESGPLPFLSGPVLPSWCGVGDVAEGNYGGLPGKAFAKVLAENWTRISPTAAYWNPTTLVSDNRIPAHGSDSSAYCFAIPGSEPIEVHVDLVYRHAFLNLIEQKGWDRPDLLLATRSLTIVDGSAVAARESPP